MREFHVLLMVESLEDKLAEQTATINDAGTYVGAGGGGALWSDSFSYDTRSNLTQRIDARGVKTNFNYLKSGSPDPLNRLQGITFDKTGADTTHGTIHEAPDITYAYMTAGDMERIYTASSSGVSTETYTYDVEGRVSSYNMALTSRASYPMLTSYLYDTANRLTEVRYPAAYGMAGNPRKTVNVAYDQTSRLSSLTVGGSVQMDQISYNDYGQATSIRVGGATANPLTEQYTFDANTGLMTNQKVKRGATSLMDLSYNYARGNSKGSINGTTGNLTNIVNNLDRNKDRKYEFDTLGRLTKALGGVAAGGTGVANWTQTYTFDRYGNKLTTAASGVTANSAAIPLDGFASQTFDAATNRITTTGHEYDNAGNMTRGKAPDGSLQRFEFDEAGRIIKIKTDAGVDIETNTYATSRERLIKENAGTRTYYAWGGSSVLCEYTETATVPSWVKSYIYAGSRLLSTITKSGASELTEYQHPDRLGTKLITNTTLNTAKEQATLPFGNLIDAETDATSNQRFTSYDRSGATGLDYAVNRTYNSGQSRFTQVDPIGMASASIGNPQSMNMYAYVQNNPIDFIDPSGLQLVSIGGNTYYCEDDRWDESTATLYAGGGCYLIGGISGGSRPPVDTGGREPHDPGGNVGGGIGGEPETSQDRLPFNSCAEFVNYLINRANEVINDNRSYPINLDSKASLMGLGLMRTAYYGYDSHISNGVAGFRNNLIRGGQNGGVYGHILFHGGATMTRNPAVTSAAAVIGVYDAVQYTIEVLGNFFSPSARNNTERSAELKGNIAGAKVGKQLGNYLRNKKRDEEKLRDNLTNILCE